MSSKALLKWRAPPNMASLAACHRNQKIGPLAIAMGAIILIGMAVAVWAQVGSFSPSTARMIRDLVGVGVVTCLFGLLILYASPGPRYALYPYGLFCAGGVYRWKYIKGFGIEPAAGGQGRWLILVLHKRHSKRVPLPQDALADQVIDMLTANSIPQVESAVWLAVDASIQKMPDSLFFAMILLQIILGGFLGWLAGYLRWGGDMYAVLVMAYTFLGPGWWIALIRYRMSLFSWTHQSVRSMTMAANCVGGLVFMMALVLARLW
ncbi:MAG: hypothetical protein IT443_04455 [Phycisphaeraceae bacterium]|nr:hypothetical protein [Phycisphaeraceae bacterium]